MKSLIYNLGWALLGVVALSAPASAGKVTVPKDGHAMNPVWSLDGKFIAFELNSFGGDGIDLFFAEIANANVTKPVQEVKLPGATGPYSGQQVVMNPTWSPDKIAVFEGSNSGGKFRLYYAAPGGAMAAEMLNTTQAPGNLQFPSVSPNGQSLAYTSDQFGKGDVMVWSRATNQIKQITKSAAASEAFPSFNKDGSRIIFNRKAATATIHDTDLATMTERQLVAGTGDMTRPVFVGEKIFFFSSERGEGKWDLLSANLDGSGRTTVVKDVKLPERSRPAVSPDGKYVSYVYSDPTKHDSVRIRDVAAGTEKEIKTEYTSCGEPALTMVGGRYLLAYTALPSNDSDWRFLYVQDVTDML
jgi:Tol biopolymer transport system component